MRATTIRFSDPIYQRLERASKYSGLPINAIVTTACMEWLRHQFPETAIIEPPSEPAGTATLGRLLEARRDERLPRLSSDARDALARAEDEARRLSHESVGTEHLLLGITAEKGSTGAQALNQIGVDFERVREALVFISGRNPRSGTRDLRLSPLAKRIIRQAAGFVDGQGGNEIDTGHLLVSLCDEPEGLALRILESLGTSADEVRASVDALM